MRLHWVGIGSAMLGSAQQSWAWQNCSVELGLAGLDWSWMRSAEIDTTGTKSADLGLIQLSSTVTGSAGPSSSALVLKRYRAFFFCDLVSLIFFEVFGGFTNILAQKLDTMGGIMILDTKIS